MRIRRRIRRRIVRVGAALLMVSGAVLAGRAFEHQLERVPAPVLVPKIVEARPGATFEIVDAPSFARPSDPGSTPAWPGGL